jgi:hypothetical protein
LIVAVCVAGAIGLAIAGATLWFAHMESTWVNKK